ncbi:formylglycine-generating enzyme family protein [Capillimicrobium parvum]|uniref:Formylglycine-generating enzyme n=1 Tax=Capillimicrobium parvum TaxID=2884022 RepID=A0A9E6Y1R0_9ACTN|nr:formylglycine-generating enzyme family protein [Capillimicrobium parvum]UGS38479.1 Formylglycine-generating enzyme [Capillimicrobium parvum]
MAAHRDTLIALQGGAFLMGTADEDAHLADREGPPREVEVAPFAIDAFTVTVERFADFVADTGHTTDAERFGWSFVFAGLLPGDFPPTRGVAAAPWWRQVHGADWAHPEGPQSTARDRLDHPVVHVSQADALAYCGWAGLRLPTEAEWEFAARGGLVQARYPWGDELTPGGEHRANIWQGTFPEHNTLEDGYLGTAPVGAFAPNGYGLHNASGNVWERVADAFEPSPGTFVMRGGSYLCHDSYCNRYRVAARTGDTPDSSSGNVGFRCAADLTTSSG